MARKVKQKPSKAQTFAPTSLKPQPDAATRPNWPALNPLIPAVDLTPTTLLHDQIILIPNLFTLTLCKTYTSFLSTLPMSTTPGKPKRGEAVRVNDRFQILDPAFAEAIWVRTGLKELVINFGDYGIWGGGVLGLNPNIRVYRYRPGQFFGKHFDESNKLDMADPPVAAKTTWTLLIYLSSCEGGETVFYPHGPRKGPTPDPIVVEVQPGLALLHRHGDDCLLHEGKEVKSGEKWVLRSDLVVMG